MNNKQKSFIAFIFLAFLIVTPVSASIFTDNLYFGIEGSSQVSKLQEFLTVQELYSGPITGNFYSLTLNALKKFQEKEGITPAAGYFGPVTREKANGILSKDIRESNKQAVVETNSVPIVATSTVQLQLDALLKQVALLQQQIAEQQKTSQAVQNLQTKVEQQTQVIQEQKQTIEQIQKNTNPPSVVKAPQGMEYGPDGVLQWMVPATPVPTQFPPTPQEQSTMLPINTPLPAPVSAPQTVEVSLASLGELKIYKVGTSAVWFHFNPLSSGTYILFSKDGIAPYEKSLGKIGPLESNTDYVIHAKVQKGNSVALVKFPIKTKMSVRCSFRNENGNDTVNNIAGLMYNVGRETNINCYFSSQGQSPNYIDIKSLNFLLEGGWGANSAAPIRYEFVLRDIGFKKIFISESQGTDGNFLFRGVRFEAPVSFRLTKDERGRSLQLYISSNVIPGPALKLESWTFEAEGKEYTYALSDMD
ncbi:MAG: peptidoglycan-binding protein [Candidatus Liptonbacteria bacterium]|nr:peptidoglycan-binding protein [Candidatus Liptonbacteria bacterium]